MRKILIATHGYLANGIKSSIDLLIGDMPNISYINAYVEEKDLNSEIDEFLNNTNENDEIIVFTDIYGGSVNQKVFIKFNDKDAFIITSFNLPVILELVLLDEKLTEEKINEIIEESRQQLMLIPKIF